LFSWADEVVLKFFGGGGHGRDKVSPDDDALSPVKVEEWSRPVEVHPATSATSTETRAAVLVRRRPDRVLRARASGTSAR